VKSFGELIARRRQELGMTQTADWTSHKGFVYDRFSFRLLRTFNYSGEGWGLSMMRST
jgi:glutamine cyclotransferase